MAPAKYNGRAPRLKWTREMRVGLSLIITEFKIVGDNRANVFNAVFAEELRASGFQGGARTKALNAQWNESRTKEHWRSILEPPTTVAETELRDRLRAKIRRGLNNDSEPSTSKTTSRQARRGSPSPVDDEDSRPVQNREPLPTPPSSNARVATRHSSAFMPATPTPSSKRRRPAPEDAALDHSDGEYTPIRSKRSRVAPVSKSVAPLSVLAYRREARPLSPLKAPSKARQRLQKSPIKKSPASSTKTPYVLLDGRTINASERLLQTLGQPLVPVTQHIAKPPLPDLFFRYYVERTPRDQNSEHGFIARKYYKSVPPGPPPATLDWKDVLDHMNRRHVETPFISCSNKLLWIIALAMKELQSAGADGRIALIDPSVIGKRAIFWAPPFHREVASKTALFENGAFRYCGNYEFLVWGAIPKEAILSTVKVVDLLNLPRSHPELGRILRYEILQDRASLTNKEILLRQQEVPLNSVTAKGIALIARCLGVTAQSPTLVVSHIVGDVVRGWGLASEFRSPQSWREIAERFVRVFLEPESGHWVGPGQVQTLKFAFLHGVRWGQGDFNARHQPKAMAKMQQKARLIGLEFPEKIISDEVDAWKIGLFAHGQTVAKLLKAPKQPLLLEEAFEDDMEEEDGDDVERGYDVLKDRRPAAVPSQPRWTFTRQMDLAHDSNDSDDDDQILYESRAAARVL